MGVFARIMVGLAAEEPDNNTISIDATYLKAHRTASSLCAKKVLPLPDRTHQRRFEYQIACRDRHGRAAHSILHDRWTGQQLYWCSCFCE